MKTHRADDQLIRKDCAVRERRHSGRFPAVSITLAVAFGIIFDRRSSLEFALLQPAFCLLAGTTVIAFCLRQRRNGAIAVLALWGIAGAIHHHMFWHASPRSDIEHFLNESPTLVQLTGTVNDRPTIYLEEDQRRAGRIFATDATHFELNCKELLTDTERISVTGRLKVFLTGRLEDVAQGDSIRLSGWVRSLTPPMNPGQFDSRAYYKGRGISGLLEVRHAELASVTNRNTSLRGAVRTWLRGRFETVLRQHMSDETKPVALAILLGDRSLIGRSQRDAFVKSGTMHILAISGLHVGILAGFLFFLGRLLRLSKQNSTLLMLVLLALYIDAADSRPPMIRAFVLIVIVCSAQLVRRPAFSLNSLAVAAMFILASNPTDLFSVGTQLSFLAVAAILWILSVEKREEDSVDVAAAPDSRRAKEVLMPAWQRIVCAASFRIRDGMVLSGSIWLVTAPLVASAFHIVSPVGLFINVLLVPCVVILLCAGFLTLLVGVASVSAASIPAFVFDSILRELLWIVDAAAGFKLSHIYVPAVPDWWLACFYLVVATAMIATVIRKRPARVWCAALLWFVFGVSLGLRSNQPNGLRCMFLSVGHGLSVVTQAPNGRVVVYDAGCRGDGWTAARTLESALWDNGITRIDALVISHSDSDHFAAAGQILESMKVGRICMSRHFPDEAQSGTLALCEKATAMNIPVDFVQAGDRLLVDPDMKCDVLHPASSKSFESDNEASVVLELTYRGRRILLTGDLKGEGLRQVLRSEPRKADVMLAPHHGDLEANSPELIAWASPDWAVSSSMRRFDPQPLEERFGPSTKVLTTSRVGAVEVAVSPAGEISVKTHRESD